MKKKIVPSSQHRIRTVPRSDVFGNFPDGMISCLQHGGVPARHIFRVMSWRQHNAFRAWGRQQDTEITRTLTNGRRIRLRSFLVAVCNEACMHDQVELNAKQTLRVRVQMVRDRLSS